MFLERQLAQLTEESRDNIFSENNFLPRAALDFISDSSFPKKELIKIIIIIADKKENQFFIFQI